MVSIQYQGRMGNQMFQYSYARLLSEILGHEFFAPPIDGFPDLVVRCKGGGLNEKDKIFLQGHFESAVLYAAVRQKIMRWFPFKERPISVAQCAIHVRGSDVAKSVGRCPPYQYYMDAVHKSDCSSFSIYTEDLRNPVVLRLKKEMDCSVFSGDPTEDMQAISKHSKIIIGNSTFAWWAAFLSGHNEIIQPAPSRGWRSKEMPHSCLQIDEWEKIPYGAP